MSLLPEHPFQNKQWNTNIQEQDDWIWEAGMQAHCELASNVRDGAA